MIMVTEIKSKCYTCLNPIALAYAFGSAGLTCCQSSYLDHRSTAHRLNLIIDHTNDRRQIYTKQTRLQLEQYANHIKTV